MKFLIGLLVIASPALLPAQALVEYGLAAAASGTTGAAGQKAASPIGGIFANLTRTLDSAREPTAQPAIPARSNGAMAAPAHAPEKAKPAIVYEDASGIRKDMDRAELLCRFGEPSMRITAGPGREALTYDSKGGRIEVELRDGKVATVQSKVMPKQQAAVVLLQ